MEAELKSYGVEHVLRSILTITEPGPVRLPKSEPFGSKSSYVSPPLPPWLSEEDIKYNVQKFEQKGFTEALNYYRALDLNWELTAPWTGIQIKVPVIFMVREKDLVYTTPGAKTYIHSGMFKKDVLLLQQVVAIKMAIDNSEILYLHTFATVICIHGACQLIYGFREVTEHLYMNLRALMLFMVFICFDNCCILEEEFAVKEMNMVVAIPGVQRAILAVYAQK
ncbi:epoxide hydrolase [Tanacetum coccineum]